MKRSQHNLADAPLWGWELATFASVTISHNLCTTLGYDEHFPLRDVATGYFTIRSLEDFKLDMMLDRLQMGPWSSPLLTSLSDEARCFLGDAFETDAGLTMGITHVINLPHEARVAYVLEIIPSESSTTFVSGSNLQQHAKTAKHTDEQSQKAWAHASRILKKWDREQRCAEFQFFLSLYPEVVDNPRHPVNAIRQDLEDAILSSNQMRFSLTCREPTPTVVRDFLDWMPVGLIIQQEETPDAQALARHAPCGRNIRPPRDGAFHAIQVGVPGETTRWIAFWHPHQEEPPFLVVKAAACTTVPSIRRVPLSNVIAPPLLEIGQSDSPLPFESTVPISEIQPLLGIDVAERIRISDLRPASRDPSDWAEESVVLRDDIRKKGTEALAWHQGFHEHTDDTWGIFFNAPKIDAFVESLYAEIMRATAGNGPNYGFTAMAIVEWIAEHEWFHARVEAALTHLELTSVAPRCVKYRTNVYARLACKSDDCLEEALANYTAHTSLLDGRNAWAALLSQKHQAILVEVLEAEMKLSPPGYRAWERGRDVHSWRSLAWELVSGVAVADAHETHPPVESLLLGPLPYDHRKSDIAWYVYGEGIVTNALLASPSTLAVPARRELTKALRYLGYSCDESRGKGSHEMWFKGGGAGFTLPRKDPVGRKVFGDFLSHSGIETKSRYLKEVRPNI